MGQFTADGAGNLTGSQTTSENGVIVAQTYTGTYSVAKNCTGNLTVDFTGGGSATAYFVFDNGKKGAQVIQTDEPQVLTGFLVAQGTGTCGLPGKKQTFALNVSGFGVGVGPVAAVGQITLSGTGTLSGKATNNINGTATQNAVVTGTYTENADCTGTAQVTLSGFPTSNYSFVVVNSGKEILLVETDSDTVVSGTMQQ